MELTILMPCLNEANSIGICVNKAMGFIKKNNIDGEVLVSDNGSTDGSVEIAKNAGARVIHTPIKGYGSALINGINNAKGKYVIMGDSDDSYDFSDLTGFVMKLREGYDLVMGNRFKGGIEKGAMPWHHQYIGNPVLSGIGRILYKSKIGDWHCGLRGFNREKLLGLKLESPGMEFASEIVLKAEKAKFKSCEIPIILHKDKRIGKPHLRSFRDGMRHLRTLFKYRKK